MDWIKVASAQELSNDEAKTVDVAGYGVALYRIDDEFFATDSMCTHATALLSEGYVEDGCVECPCIRAASTFVRAKRCVRRSPWTCAPMP